MLCTQKDSAWIYFAVLLFLVMSQITNGVEQVSNVTSDDSEKTNEPNAVPRILTTDQILKQVQNQLLSDFNGYLKSEKEYSKLVKTNCSMFPEGDLFPYIYPALGYVNIALKDPNQKSNSISQSQKLIDLAINSVTNKVRPPEGRLVNLRSYRNQATYLGQLNMVLGAYYLISQDNRYNKLHQVLSDILHDAMVDSEGRALNSFPQYSWPFDTVPVLLSLSLYDKKISSTRSAEIITQHLEWVREKASDPLLELPFSRINNVTGQGRELPRGCDLSFRLCLLSHIDQKYSKHLYEKYTTHYWLDYGIFAGFSEWPNGHVGFEDIDSGPIFMRIGLGATGMGLGAVTALEDNSRLDRLTSQMMTASKYILPLLANGQKLLVDDNEIQVQMIPLNDKYISGFLFGDAMLFYCVTWEPWTNCL